MKLSELFPAEEFRFRMGLRPVDPPEFFRPRDPSGRVLAERARWLEADPERYACLEPEGEPLLGAFQYWLSRLGLDPKNAQRSSVGGFEDRDGAMIRPARRCPKGEAGPGSDGAESLLVQPSASAVRRSDPSSGLRDSDLPPAVPPPSSLSLCALGRRLEPDVLFLSPDAAGEPRLRGGVLCFPTGWALREKLGGTVEEIHGIVPGLNRALGPALGQMLVRLSPGEARGRSNWGLAATPELNLHPALGRPAPTPPAALDRLWLRVEEQLLAALPGTKGLVFAIRIELIRLDELVRDPAAAAGLARALRSLPAPLAAYKRLDTVREPLLALLGS
jgi:hypothetical protein